MEWNCFPLDVPADEQVCWIRIQYYYGQPFRAVYYSATETFISVINSISYPVYTVARWRAE